MILLNLLDMWHISISWQWTFTSSNFMNLLDQFCKTFHTLWYSFFQLLAPPPHFTFFAFSLFIGCVYMEVSRLDVEFSLVFHYNISKPKASSASPSMVFDYQASVTTNVVQGWIMEVHGILVQLVVGSDYKNLIHDVLFLMNKVPHTTHGVGFVKLRRFCNTLCD